MLAVCHYPPRDCLFFARKPPVTANSVCKLSVNQTPTASANNNSTLSNNKEKHIDNATANQSLTKNSYDVLKNDKITLKHKIEDLIGPPNAPHKKSEEKTTSADNNDESKEEFVLFPKVIIKVNKNCRTSIPNEEVKKTAKPDSSAEIHHRHHHCLDLNTEVIKHAHTPFNLINHNIKDDADNQTTHSPQLPEPLPNIPVQMEVQGNFETAVEPEETTSTCEVVNQTSLPQSVKVTNFVAQNSKPVNNKINGVNAKKQKTTNSLIKSIKKIETKPAVKAETPKSLNKNYRSNAKITVVEVKNIELPVKPKIVPKRTENCGVNTFTVLNVPNFKHQPPPVKKAKISKIDRVTLKHQRKRLCKRKVTEDPSPKPRNDHHNAKYDFGVRIHGCSDNSDSSVYSSSDYESDPSEIDLFIKSGPPIKLDCRPEKMRFFKCFELTTHHNRNLLEFKKIEKCLWQSPWDQMRTKGVTSTETFSLPIPHHSPSLLNMSDDYVDKRDFFRGFSLQPVPEFVREQYENLWMKVVKERLKRNGSSTLTQYYEKVNDYRKLYKCSENKSISQFDKSNFKCNKQTKYPIFQYQNRSKYDNNGDSKACLLPLTMIVLNQPPQKNAVVVLDNNSHVNSETGKVKIAGPFWSNSSNEVDLKIEPSKFCKLDNFEMRNEFGMVRVPNPEVLRPELLRPEINASDCRQQKEILIRIRNEVKSPQPSKILKLPRWPGARTSNGFFHLEDIVDEVLRSNNVTENNAASRALEVSKLRRVLAKAIEVNREVLEGNREVLEGNREAVKENREAIGGVKYKDQATEMEDTNFTEQYKWPGVQEIAESYKRHIEEQAVECNFLKRRCSSLKDEVALKQEESKYLERRQRELHCRLFVFKQEKQRMQKTIDQLMNIINAFM